MKIPNATRTAMCQALIDLIDASDPTPGYIEIRSGTPPSSPNDAASGTLLATLTLPLPSFGTVTNGSVDAEAISTSAGVADNTATWFRVFSGAAATVEDGTVSATGDGGDLQLNTTTISTGVDVLVTSWSITVPES